MDTITESSGPSGHFMGAHAAMGRPESYRSSAANSSNLSLNARQSRNLSKANFDEALRNRTVSLLPESALEQD